MQQVMSACTQFTHTQIGLQLPFCLLYVTQRINRVSQTLAMSCCLDTSLCVRYIPCCLACLMKQCLEVFICCAAGCLLCIALYLTVTVRTLKAFVCVCVCPFASLPSLNKKKKKSSITYSIPAAPASSMQLN